MLSWTEERGRVASLSRSRSANDPELLAARRRLAVARFEERVRAAVESAPPLPADVATRVVELIRSVSVVDQAVGEAA